MLRSNYKVLKENISNEVKEHIVPERRCPYCRGVVLKDWFVGAEYVCPECFRELDKDDLYSYSSLYDESEESFTNRFSNSIATYLLRDKPI